jgi:hypothetical protein
MRCFTCSQRERGPRSVHRPEAAGICINDGYVKRVSNRFTTALKRVAYGVVIVLLVIIPVPIGRVFARLFDRKPKPVAALVVKREDETDFGPRREKR